MSLRGEEAPEASKNYRKQLAIVSNQKEQSTFYLYVMKLYYMPSGTKIIPLL